MIDLQGDQIMRLEIGGSFIYVDARLLKSEASSLLAILTQVTFAGETDQASYVFLGFDPAMFPLLLNHLQ